jgi:hypothetical protein
LFAAARAANSYHASHRSGRAPPAGSKATASKEDDVKELSLEEVLRIAGGVPVSAALDEITYRTPQESAADPVDYARLLGKDLRPSEPS